MCNKIIRYNFIIAIFFLIIPLQTYSQLQGRNFIDSLLKVLPMVKNDTNRVRIFSGLSFSYNSVNYDSGIKYGYEGLYLSEKLKWKNGIAELYDALGVNFRKKGEYPKALKYHMDAIKIYEELNDILGVAKTNIDIGKFYYIQSNYAKALEYYFEALKMLKERNSKHAYTKLLTDIAMVYQQQGNFQDALIYSNQALTIYEKSGTKKGIAENLDIMGDIFLQQNNFVKAFQYNIKALNIYTILGNNTGKATIYSRIGKTYLRLFDFSIKSNKYETQNFADSSGYLTKAICYLDSSLNIFKQLDDKRGIMEVTRNLSLAYSEYGSYDKAYSFLKQFVQLKDSLFSYTNNLKIANIESEREKVLNDKIEKLANTKKIIILFSISIVIILLLFIISIIYRNNKRQRKSNKLLTKTNNQLVNEKKRSDDLLLNILPLEVAEELKEKGCSEAKYFDDVTVLFTDFKGFSTIAESMTPQKLVGELDACFKAFDAIIDKYNIEKIKTVGDAYLAVCGLPATDPKHAENIVNAAIEIKNFMLGRLEQLGEHTFEIRIGVHSGNVVAGIVGIKKFAYDIWGDTVNLAARMEQNSMPGKINISQSTYDLVKDKFTCIHRGKIAAKNKGELNMYFVEN